MVVIAILAAITVVAYNGITKQATESVLKSDLQQVSTQLGMVKVTDGVYPNDNSGLKVSSGTNLQYTKNSDDAYCATVQAKGQSFYLDSTTGSIKSGICGSHEDISSYVALDASDKKQWKQVGAGFYYTCAVASDDQAYCWGRNMHGQLGINSYLGYLTSVNTPFKVSGLLWDKSVKSLGVGSHTVCAIVSDDNAYCWGAGYYGMLGNNSTESSGLPVLVDTSGALLGKTIGSISAKSGQSVCAVASDERAYCWGRSVNGELGNGSAVGALTPGPIYTGGTLEGKSVRSISVGASHTCAIDSSGSAYCWGQNSYGALGSGLAYTDSHVPYPVRMDGVLAGKTLKSISSGGSYTCAIASDSKAYCWGRNSNGQLGDGSTVNSLIPIAVKNDGALEGKAVRQVSVGNQHSCVVASDGWAYCWGDNSGGQLGDGTTTSSQVPVPIQRSGTLAGKRIRSISLGVHHTCAVASDNQIYCWGTNSHGELGNGTNTNSLAPVLVSPRP